MFPPQAAPSSSYDSGTGQVLVALCDDDDDDDDDGDDDHDDDHDNASDDDQADRLEVSPLTLETR